MEKTGMLLWDLNECAEFLEELSADQLSRLVVDVEHYGSEVALIAMGVVYSAVPSAWSVTRDLTFAVRHGEPWIAYWAEKRKLREDALALLLVESLPVGAKVAELAQALELVLSLDPDSVRTIHPLPMEQIEAVDLLDRITARLDQFERRIKHRGWWPR